MLTNLDQFGTWFATLSLKQQKRVMKLINRKVHTFSSLMELINTQGISALGV